MADAPTFRTIVAIVHKVLREYPNVTDAKDVARQVFARLRLEVDVPTLDRALAAALEARDKAARAAATADHSHTEQLDDSINWARVWDRLAEAGLVPHKGARDAVHPMRRGDT